MLRAITKLQPHDDTVANFIANFPVRMDLSSLAPLGYEVMDADLVLERWRKKLDRGRAHFDLTMIGFNDARDQALIHRWGQDGELIRLDRIDGVWLVTGRAMTFPGY
jgi:hypothetical protein